MRVAASGGATRVRRQAGDAKCRWGKGIGGLENGEAPLAALPNGLFLVAVLSNLPKIASIRETDMTLAQRGEPHGSNVQMRPLMVCKRFSIHSLPCLCDTRFVIRSITDASLYLHISGARLETCAVSPLACCRLPPPTCFCPGSHLPRARVPLVVWARDFLLCGFLAAVSRPLLAHCFSLCDLRLFVDKRMLLPALLRPHFFWRRSHATGAGVRPWSRPLALLPGQAARAALYQH